MEEKTTIEIPVGMESGVDHDGKQYYVLFTTDETKKYIGNMGIVTQGETLEEAKEEFLKSLKSTANFWNWHVDQFRRWKPLQIGPWGQTAGHWFRIFGIQFYFRVGKNMKHGWYIPFTNLNIMITNYWRIKTEQV